MGNILVYSEQFEVCTNRKCYKGEGGVTSFSDPFSQAFYGSRGFVQHLDLRLYAGLTFHSKPMVENILV